MGPDASAGVKGCVGGHKRDECHPGCIRGQEGRGTCEPQWSECRSRSQICCNRKEHLPPR